MWLPAQKKKLLTFSKLLEERAPLNFNSDHQLRNPFHHQQLPLPRTRCTLRTLIYSNYNGYFNSIHPSPRSSPGPCPRPAHQGRGQDCQRDLPPRVQRREVERGQGPGCWPWSSGQGGKTPAHGRRCWRPCLDSLLRRLTRQGWRGGVPAVP